MPALRRLRLVAGYSQQELADAAGVHKATITQLESGRRRPRPSTMRRIAEVLGVGIADIDEFRERLPD